MVYKLIEEIGDSMRSGSSDSNSATTEIHWQHHNLKNCVDYLKQGQCHNN